MPWHQSVSNPRKVYNERHEQVCICETPKQAALIVEAVRAHTPRPNLFACENVASKPGEKQEATPRARKKPEPVDDGSFAIV